MNIEEMTEDRKSSGRFKKLHFKGNFLVRLIELLSFFRPQSHCFTLKKCSDMMSCDQISIDSSLLNTIKLGAVTGG